MIKKLLSRSILAALFAIPGLAFSGDYCCKDSNNSSRCGYIFGYGGYSFDFEVDGNEPLFPSNDRFEMNAGYIFGGGAGLYSDFLCGSRFEVEGLYTNNDIGRITSDVFDGNGFQDFGIRGQRKTKAVMVNWLKEVPVCGLNSYVGGGIGFSENTLTLNFGAPVPPAPPVAYGSPESATALAYQFIAGVDMPVTCNVDLFLQYKLLGVGETEYEQLDLVLDNHFSHNMVFGARMSF